MNHAKFLTRLAEVLDHDGAIVANQDVESIDEWDSLGLLSVIELLADIGVKGKTDELGDITNISQLLELVKQVVHE